MKTEILDTDYNKYISILGTAHFTRRSLLEAYRAVEELTPTDLAIELDMQRFQHLNYRCGNCPSKQECAGQCEFVGATKALGNIDANIWLIDMSEKEIADRIRQLVPASNWYLSFLRFPLFHQRDDEVTLWEKGYKDEVLQRHARRLKSLRTKAPHVWRVLIDERNTLMAARLSWIVTKKLNQDEQVKVLALTGAAHVEGIKDLLASPIRIREELLKSGLSFSVPRLVRRVGVN
ncbi:MAG: hypothetical protein NWE78_04070 [Candidatus Bathyarchaeota archaeon]|nr:hypothetical protein [Candidatus Bathyarchaeota archaeon]